MAKIIVFHESKLYKECDTWPKIIPSGSIVRDGRKAPVQWYRAIALGHNTPINYSDIPSEVKMLCLVLNIPL